MSKEFKIYKWNHHGLIFIIFTWNVWPLTVSCWGGGLFADVFDFLSSAAEALLSVSISSEDISDDDVDDVEFFKNSYMLLYSLFMWRSNESNWEQMPIPNKCTE